MYDRPLAACLTTLSKEDHMLLTHWMSDVDMAPTSPPPQKVPSPGNTWGYVKGTMTALGAAA